MKNLSAFILALIFVLQISCRSKDEMTTSVFEGQLSVTAGGGSNFSNRINDFKTIIKEQAIQVSKNQKAFATDVHKIKILPGAGFFVLLPVPILSYCVNTSLNGNN